MLHHLAKKLNLKTQAKVKIMESKIEYYDHKPLKSKKNFIDAFYIFTTERCLQTRHEQRSKSF